MSTTLEILVVVNGETKRLADCRWVQYAPCGCICTITATISGGNPLATPGQVDECMGTSKREAERERELGFTWKLEENDANLYERFKDCEHEPTWGVEPRPTLDGYEWGVDYSAPLGAIAHLVHEGTVRCRGVDFDAPRAAPLCKPGLRPKRWRNDAHAVECKTCMKKATR